MIVSRSDRRTKLWDGTYSVTPINTLALSQKMWKETVCPWMQQQSDGDKGRRISVTGSLRVTSASWDCLAAQAFHAHIGWEFLTGGGKEEWARDAMKDSDSGCHIWGGGRSKDMSHPSSQSGRASFLARRLIWDWLISKRKSDGGMQEAVFREERWFRACEMREKMNQKDSR